VRIALACSTNLRVCQGVVLRRGSWPGSGLGDDDHPDIRGSAELGPQRWLYPQPQ
jgi:hypothetical protein